MPRTSHGAFLLGGVCEHCGLLDLAEHYYVLSLRNEASNPRGWHRLGLVRIAKDDFGKALAALRYACALDDRNEHYKIDYSMGLARAGHFSDALSAAVDALAISPNNIIALNNAGHALQCLNRSYDALEYYDRALEIDPGHAALRFGRATALLKSGNYSAGWREYEWRWLDCQTLRTDIDVPVWEGEDLYGKTILIHHEQGYGDSLQFFRLLPQLAQKGARVIVQVPPPLVRLAQGVEGVFKAFPVLEKGTYFDVHCPLLSLPARLNYDPRQKAAEAYLNTGADQSNGCFEKVGRAMKVGLVWAGDPRPGDIKARQTDLRRSVSLEALAPLLALPDMEFISFQMGQAAVQRQKYANKISDGTKDIIDFFDTSVRLREIDILIAVDTSIAHLMAGMGRTVWLLSRFDACWRWGDAGDTTPWYSTMRIFRQSKPGSWQEPVHAMVQALGEFITLKAAV
ncbi:hypothetical protein D5366_04825 [Neokomagataea tanensis]|uniref:Uncharacterized protein n=2 Tax=Neokomagataea TaxID=1223423 RepID=A0A4Y6V7K4_9PROT|nr:hypothetical protein D5366_04825 [Neokomagataea tanensis]